MKTLQVFIGNKAEGFAVGHETIGYRDVGKVVSFAFTQDPATVMVYGQKGKVSFYGVQFSIIETVAEKTKKEAEAALKDQQP